MLPSLRVDVKPTHGLIRPKGEKKKMKTLISQHNKGVWYKICIRGERGNRFFPHRWLRKGGEAIQIIHKPKLRGRH